MNNIEEIDATGLKCPLPVLRLQKALRGARVGTILRLRASDPMAEIDVPHFCAEAGHAFLGAEEGDGASIYTVRKGG